MPIVTEKIKVLHIPNGHPTPTLPGFYPFIAGQIKALASKVEVNVIVPVAKLIPIPRHREHLRFSSNFPAQVRAENYAVLFPRFYRYFPLMNKYLADHLAVWVTLYAIWRNKKKFDLIHANFAHPSGFIAAIISTIFKKPYLLTVQGSDIFEKFLDAKEIKRRRHHRNHALKKATKVICISQNLKKAVIDLGIPEEKTVLIPNGVDTNIFDVRSNIAPDNILLFIGNLIELKGVDLLIDAFKKISTKNPGLILKIIGDGPLRKKLFEQATRLGLGNQVEFLGPKGNLDIAQIIPTAKLLCLPSRQEGFGVVLIEALACGVPVVGARTGGIVDIIKSEEIGFLFEPGDSNDLALKLEAALNKKWDQNVIRQAGLKYSWDRIANQIVEQYLAVLNR